MKLVSLCSGYGGLDRAVEAVTGATTVAFSELEPSAAAIFARHWPDARPLGDLTQVGWTTVEADVVCAGFPCQDLSYAGKGRGIVADSRSGLWYAIEHALGVLRPRLVVLENVSAIVARRPGLDVVLAGLARLGFDAEWTCVRASDVGAPHRRERWFLVAYAEGRCESFVAARHDGREAMDRTVAGTGGGDRGGRLASRVPVVGRGARAQWEDAADAVRAGAGRHRGGLPRETREGGRQGVDVRAARDGRPNPADADGGRRGQRREQDGGTQQPGLEAPRRDDAGRRDPAPTDADLAGLEGREPAAGRDVPAWSGAWGDYAPAIARWEHVLGRPAPAPTDDRGRLSPAFVEWMMGLPQGWVTDTPGLSRSKQLKALGNGVVPQQATYALTSLLEVQEVAA